MKNQAFNLEKIKEITAPIEELEGQISSMEDIRKRINNKLLQLNEIYSEENIQNSVEEISKDFKPIQKNIVEISKANLNKFLIFQDLMIKKYKDKLKEEILKFYLNRDKTKKLGLYLIQNRMISTIISESLWIPSISLKKWIELLDSLKENTLFSSVINKVAEYYENLKNRRLNEVLNKIPEGTDNSLVKQFKQKYLINPLSFREFLLEFEKKLSEEELKSKEEIIKRDKEKQKIKRLKQKQEEQRNSFQEYFKYSDKEFQRRNRKKKRKSLSEISEKPDVKQELSDEVSEKIEKFKSKFDHKFENEFLIKKDDEIDPLELIRERKEEKKKEYKQFIKRLENKE